MTRRLGDVLGLEAGSTVLDVACGAGASAIAMGRGLSRLTLYVAASNDGARRLYDRLGFDRQGSIRSRTTRWLFGVEEWLFMVRSPEQSDR